MKKVFEEIEKYIKQAEEICKKDIANEKNPILKMIKQDFKDLSEIQNKLNLLYPKYGITVRLVFPKKLIKINFKK